MSKNDFMAELQTTIEQLESKQSTELKALKGQLHEAYEDIRPSKMIANTIKELGASVEVKDFVLYTGIAIAAGFLTVSAVGSYSKRPFNRALGKALMVVLLNNPDTVKLVSRRIIGLFKKDSPGKDKVNKLGELQVQI